MKKFLRKVGLLTAAVTMMSSGAAYALEKDAVAANTLRTGPAFAAGEECTQIRNGRTCYYRFEGTDNNALPNGNGDGVTHDCLAGETLDIECSGIFNVTTPKADVCFIPDVDVDGGAARVTLRRVIQVGATTALLSFELPSSTLDGTDCYTITAGQYYITPTVKNAVAGNDSLVSVTGRN